MGAECPLPDAEFVPQVNDLHTLRGELEERIKRLKAECPTEREAERIELEGKFFGSKIRWEDLLSNISRRALRCYVRFLATQNTERPNGIRSPFLRRVFSTESIQVRVLLMGFGRGLRSDCKLS
jgi:hypothetical protein